MAIIDDYAAIAAAVARLRRERSRNGADVVGDDAWLKTIRVVVSRGRVGITPGRATSTVRRLSRPDQPSGLEM